MLSACLSMWTESQKICKAWALIDDVLPRCFRSYGLWLNKSNHQVKQVDIIESTNINQSISINQFYPIEVVFSHNPSKFIMITHARRVLLFKEVKSLSFLLYHPETNKWIRQFYKSYAFVIIHGRYNVYIVKLLMVIL